MFIEAHGSRQIGGSFFKGFRAPLKGFGVEGPPWATGPNPRLNLVSEPAARLPAAGSGITAGRQAALRYQTKHNSDNNIQLTTPCFV